DADDVPGRLRRQDRVDHDRRRVPGGGRESRRSPRGRGRAALPERVGGHAAAVGRRLRGRRPASRV
ncbi:MAG: hypothetical protein AVDCRST_MAG79-3084, partial [uncultured Thermoleophilia bacterium]